MKPSILLSLFFVIVLGGGAALFYYQHQLPDTEFMAGDISERLLTIDGLDSKVSEYALRSRVNLDTNYDALVNATVKLSRAVQDLEKTYFNNSSMQGSLLEQRFTDFKSEVISKNDLVESFKSHNSVLRNSEKYTPIVGRELVLAAEREGLSDIARFYSEVVLSVLQYARQGEDVDAAPLNSLLSQIPATETKMPAEHLSSIIEFTNHVETVIEEKPQTDLYLISALSSTSDNSMEQVSQSLNAWLSGYRENQGKFKLATMAYILLLLVFIGVIAFKLRNLYLSLDNEVAVRTEEIKLAYEDLKKSERQLMQTEKMASLGLLIAGVAHEINTPLSYISSNIETVKANMAEMDGMMTSAEMMSKEVSKSPSDKQALVGLIKRIVIAYRNLIKRETLSDIDELLKDSSYGLNEISQLVNSLKDFSRLDSSNTQQADIHENLDATIKICGHVLGNRELVKTYDDDFPKVECMPGQLNQVFMNIITNAAQATKEEKGIIEIETKSTDNDVHIIFKDNGYGMDEETLGRIFDPFFTTKEVNEGTGLGMSLTYKIVNNHGGDINVVSEPDKGAQFTIRLPIKKVQLAA